MESNVLDKEWRAADAENNKERWMHVLTAEEITDIDYALQTTLQRGHSSCDTVTKEDFPLRTSAPTLDLLLASIENDMGMFVLRGFPVENYTVEQMRMIYWGIGLDLGTAVSQSGKGDVIGDVKNFAKPGKAISSHTAKGRGYMSNEPLNFHTDSCDIVSLIVLQTAPLGGKSMICSSVAIRNEIAKRRPDLLKLLYEPFYWSWKGTEPPGAGPYYKRPIFTEQNGRFSARYISMHIHTAQEYPDVPRLTEAQKEAIKMVDEIANEPEIHFGMMFEPGDIQILNNHITMHARTEFVDGDTEETKRHLLRMWLSPRNSRQLSDGDGFFQVKDKGVVRGGFPCWDGKRLYRTPAVDV